ncbi:MAG: B12-binding domain-containing radical SAM protein, partial [Nanoarchaeota archaeon]|nr:B12-binding domain-containing radical SAM protein [Nanoarchaeota archaeon]MBU1704433.1 B12-binding domain-containing radical SAM protein [Nanoarchaeota archaeon]
MKIMLIHWPNPGYNDPQQNIIPNGLYYIAAILKEKGFDVYLNNCSEDINEDIKRIAPDLIGISCYTFNAASVFELCDSIKKNNQNIKIILGGPHATTLCDEILIRIASVDIIVNGEGEETFLELASGKAIKDIKGIAYREKDQIKHNPPREPTDIETLPIPARYYNYQRIITSRGCPGACIFCSTPQFWGRDIRFRSPESVIKEIELLNKNYGTSYFIFSDDTFTANKKRTIDICRLILENGLKITWDCRSRVNFICKEQLEWMKKAGCISISYGIESGSQKILNNLNKHINLGQINKATKNTKIHGMQLSFFLIVGSPGEDEQSIHETIEMLKNTRPHNIMVSIMNLTPDIALAKYVPIDLWFKKMTKPIYYTKELNIEKLEEFTKEIYLEFDKVRGHY